MSDSLSQSEIDAILDAFPSQGAAFPGGAAPPASPQRDEVASYDFSHPELLSRDQIRAIRTIHESYAQALAKRLSTEFLSNVAASVTAVDHLTYGEFLTLLTTPTVMSVIEVPELEGNIAIELNPNLAFWFLDRTLGGPGTPIAKIRALTAIEQGLMERVVRTFCHELSMVWAPYFHLEFRPQSIEGNPELARVIAPNEMIVLVSMDLKANDISGTLNLCLPYVVMEPALQRLGHGAVQTAAKGRISAVAQEALDRSVRSCEVSVDVDLGRTSLSLRDIFALEVGDVLRLTPPNAWGAMGSLEGIPRLAGVPGRHRGNRAIEIMGPAEAEASEREDQQ